MNDESKMFGIQTKYIDEMRKAMVDWNTAKEMEVYEQLGFQIPEF